MHAVEQAWHGSTFNSSAKLDAVCRPAATSCLSSGVQIHWQLPLYKQTENHPSLWALQLPRVTDALQVLIKMKGYTKPGVANHKSSDFKRFLPIVTSTEFILVSVK